MIELYKEKHNNETCVIVGNGPSLKETPLDLIKYPTFAMNRIGLIYSNTKWRPTYFICPTGNSKREDWKKDILKSVSLGIPCWFWDTSYNRKIYGSYSNVEFLNCTQHKESATIYQDPPLEWFSTNPNKFVSKYGTSLLVAMQLAFYMGFKKIYLVGCDLGFSKQKHHFSEKYNLGGHAPLSKLDGTMIAAHKLSKKAGEKYNVEIYNATPKGSLKVYPMVGFNEIIYTN